MKFHEKDQDILYSSHAPPKLVTTASVFLLQSACA